MNLEESIQWIAEDELVEITPEHIRLRKVILPANRRPKKKKKTPSGSKDWSGGFVGSSNPGSPALGPPPGDSLPGGAFLDG